MALNERLLPAHKPGDGLLRRVYAQITNRKPKSVILDEDQEGHLERSLELSDLLAIGIGGTVGR